MNASSRFFARFRWSEAIAIAAFAFAGFAAADDPATTTDLAPQPGVETILLGGDDGGGTLVNNGTIEGDVRLNAGGRLGGNGFVTGAVQNAGGTLAAGNSIGTANYGSLNQTGGVVEVEIAPGSNTPGVHNDLYSVAGGAVIDGGTVSVLSAPGAYVAGTEYTFLTAGGGVSGTGFDGIVDDLSFYDAILVYDPNSVGFRLTAVGNATFAGIGRSTNQAAVGAYLDDVAPTATGDLDTTLDDLRFRTDGELVAAFDALGGHIYPTMATAQLQQFSQNLAMVRERLARNRPASVADTFGGWIGGYGRGGAANHDGRGAFGYEHETGGVDVGLQRGFGDAFALGAFGNFGWSSLRMEDLNERAQVDAYQFGVSLHSVSEDHYGVILIGGGAQEYEVDRQIDEAGIDRDASASFGGSHAFLYSESGVLADLETSYFQPFSALQFVHIRQHEFAESGAGSLNLQGERIEVDSFRYFLGNQFENVYPTLAGLLTLRLRGAWMHEFAATRRSLRASFVDAPSGAGTFVLYGTDLGRDWFVAGGGLDLAVNSHLSLFVVYDGQYNANVAYHTGSTGLELRW